MNLQLTSEQAQFAEALRRWVDRAYGFEHRQLVVATQAGVDSEDWKALTELGLTALGVPEAQNGLGGCGIDHMIAMQVMGRALLTEPLFTTLWACAYLRNVATESPWLSRVLVGEAKLACALGELTSRYDDDQINCSIDAVDGGWRLNGSKVAVLHGAQADALLVSARVKTVGRASDGLGLLVVPARLPGVNRLDSSTIDGRRCARIDFQDVLLGQEAMIAEGSNALKAFDAGFDFGVSLLCSEALGVIESINECTLEYLRTREQFGAPIGKFQSLQHRMAEMFIEQEQARSMALLAAIKVDTDDPRERRRYVSAAKYRIGRSLRFVGQQAVQLHGGLGVCEEMRVSHFFRRATALEMLLGDNDDHLERFMAASAISAE